MRIVHVSHNGLPDPRVEKAALTMKKEGHTLVFVGGQSIRYQNLDAFDETHFMPTGDSVTIALSRSMPQAWHAMLKEVKPDVIHAHNITAARYAMTFGVPMIYDDHELWSKQRWLIRRPGYRMLLIQPYVRMIPIWEKRLARRFPCIATNENAAQVLRGHGAAWVGVVRNLPMAKMVKDLPLDEPRKGVVYVGNDFSRPAFVPHRDMTGLRERIDVEVVSGLPYREMLERLCKFQVGLTPWHEHPILEYKDQNRNYEYLHAGLQVFVNQQIKGGFADEPYVHAFRDYADLERKLATLAPIEPQVIAAAARERYVWEHQESVIREAYRRALA